MHPLCSERNSPRRRRPRISDPGAVRIGEGGCRPEPRIIARHGLRSVGFSEAGDESGNRVCVDPFAPKCGLGLEATLAHIGLTSTNGTSLRQDYQI